MRCELAKRCAYDVIKGVNDLSCICVGAFMGFFAGAIWNACHNAKSEDSQKKDEGQNPKETEA